MMLALLSGLLDLLLARVAVTGPVAVVANIGQAQQCYAVVCPWQVPLFGAAAYRLFSRLSDLSRAGTCA